MEVIRRARLFGDVPILVLSARGAVGDRIPALSEGADDYLPKPFSPAELVVRVATILRRTERGRRAATTSCSPWAASSSTSAATASRSTASRRCSARSSCACWPRCSRRGGRVLTRDQLLDAIHGAGEGDVLDRSIDQYVRRLREKLGDDPAEPRYVATVRGAGYRAAVPVVRRTPPDERRADGTGERRRDGLSGADPGRGAGRRRGRAADRRRRGAAGRRGQSFEALMMAAGASADHAREMFDQSVTVVFGVAALVAARWSRSSSRWPSPGASPGRWSASRPPPRGSPTATSTPACPRRGPPSCARSPPSYNAMAARLAEQEAVRREFIVNASHELRTPLTNLQGYLEALRDGVLPPDPATFDSLREEVDRLTRLAASLDVLAGAEASAGVGREWTSGRSWRVGRPRGAGARPALDRARASTRRPGSSSGPAPTS